MGSNKEQLAGAALFFCSRRLVGRERDVGRLEVIECARCRLEEREQEGLQCFEHARQEKSEDGDQCCKSY